MSDSNSTTKYPVTIGLHTFHVTLGTAIKIASDGTLLICEPGKAPVKTNRNINDRPPEFHNSPLKGDVMNIVKVSQFYADGTQKKVHPMFSTWKSVLALTAGGIKFHKLTTDSGNLFGLKVGETLLVATSETPDKLLYIEENGERFFYNSGSVSKDIPVTAEYVKKCQRDYRDYMKKEELEKLKALEAASPRTQPNRSKKSRKKQLRKEKFQQAEKERLAVELDRKEAEYKARLTTQRGVPVIPMTQTLATMGIASEVESDKVAQAGDALSKAELAKRAGEKWRAMQAEQKTN